MRCNSASRSSSCWRIEWAELVAGDMTAILPDRQPGGRRGAMTRRTRRRILPDMADRFYVNCRLAPGNVELRGPEAHHLATVLRARAGDAVCLFNGDGAEYPATVVEA